MNSKSLKQNLLWFFIVMLAQNIYATWAFSLEIEAKYEEFLLFSSTLKVGTIIKT